MEVVRLWVLVVALASLFYLFISISAGDFTQNSSGTRRRSPVDSLCVQLIEPAGYPCTEFTIQTEDGYLLAIQRVASRIGNLIVQRGPPVLLQHELFMAGDAWFLDSTEQSLGFILADHGFDVWVGNVRGTRWSHGHMSLSEKDKVYKACAYPVPYAPRPVCRLLDDSSYFYVAHTHSGILGIIFWCNGETRLKDRTISRSLL